MYAARQVDGSSSEHDVMVQAPSGKNRCDGSWLKRAAERRGTSQNTVHILYVVVVVFTLTDRASTIIPSNIRGCQSGTWSQRGTNTGGHFGTCGTPG